MESLVYECVLPTDKAPFLVYDVSTNNGRLGLPGGHCVQINEGDEVVFALKVEAGRVRLMIVRKDGE